jgi:hypothetical protein
MGCMARIREEDDSELTRTAYLEGRPLHLRQQQLWAQYVRVGRLKTGPQIAAESGWGPLEWSVLSPTAVHRDGSSTSLYGGPIAGGLFGTGRVRTGEC